MNIRFYLNEGRRCAQTAIKSVVGRNVSYEILDSLTGRRTGEITTPVQIAYALQQLDVDFVYHVKPLFFQKNSEEIKAQSLDEFGKENCDKTNFEFIQKARIGLLKSGVCFPTNVLNLTRMSSLIENGRTPICLVNYDLFVQRENNKNGHYILVHEIGKDFARILDSGPCDASADKKISREIFEQSLMQTPIDYGCVFV